MTYPSIEAKKQATAAFQHLCALYVRSDTWPEFELQASNSGFFLKPKLIDPFWITYFKHNHPTYSKLIAWAFPFLCGIACALCLSFVFTTCPPILILPYSAFAIITAKVAQHLASSHVSFLAQVKLIEHEECLQMKSHRTKDSSPGPQRRIKIVTPKFP